MLNSYRSAREIRLTCWRYRQRVVEVAAAGKECDGEVPDAMFCETEEEEEDIAESAPSRDDHKVGMSASAAGSEEE